VIVRQEPKLDGAAKSKLQDVHAGQAEAVAQFVDVFRDEAEVLGYERKFPEFAADRVKQPASGAGTPLADLRGGRAVGDVPRGRETAKVVKPHEIDLP
jgi:hypothetical protein